MKKYIENLAKASFVMLAVVAAFAFTTPMVSPTGEMFGLHDGEWYDATEASPDVDYECSPSSEVCLYDRKVALPQYAIPNSVGSFQPITLTPDNR